MSDYRNRLQLGLAPHDWNLDQWTALEMDASDYGRTWSLSVPVNLPGNWTRCLWSPEGLSQLWNVPGGATVIFCNEPNLPYEPLHESAELEAEYAAALFVYARQMRPDLRWWVCAVNGNKDAWSTGGDGLPYPYFRAFIGHVFGMLRVVDRFGMARPFEAVDAYVLNWYENDHPLIPAAWRSPVWAAERLTEAAEHAGLTAPRPVVFGEIGVNNHADVMAAWLDELYASPIVRAAYWFTPYHPDKAHLSLLRANNSRRATGDVFVEAKRRMR